MHLTRFLLMKAIDDDAFLLINTLSGAIDIIGKKEVELLSSLRKGDDKILLDEEIEKKLRERGYLFKNPEEEETAFNQLIELFREYQQTTLPEFYLCYTYHCNLRCTYCNERHLNIQGRNTKVMEIPQLEAALNTILTIREHSKTTEKGVIVLSGGGEPLLPTNKETVIRTLNFARIKNFSVRIVSNGTLIEEFIKILWNFRDVIKTIAISLDGPPSVNDKRRKAAKGSSFTAIVKGINLLLSAGLEVEVRPIVDQENISFLPVLADFIINQGWPSYKNFSAKIAKTMFPLPSAKLNYPFLLSNSEFLKQLNELIKKYPVMSIFSQEWLGDFEPFVYLREILNGQELVAPQLLSCRAVTPGLYIFGPDNLIYPCLELVGLSQYAVGRFYSKFEEFPLRERWRKFNILNWSQKCKHCNLITLCGGGCPLTYLVYSKQNRSNQECLEIKETLDVFLEINKSKFINLIKN